MSFLFKKKKKPLSAIDEKLIKYAYYGNLQEVRNLLQAGANVNAQYIYGETALWQASEKGHVEVVKALLTNDMVDVNIHENYDGVTALLMASQEGHVEIATALLQHNNEVQVNVQDPGDGATALHMASQQGYVEVVEELLRHNNVDVNLRNDQGQTALCVACDHGNFEVVAAFLRDNRVDVNVETKIGSTALNVAYLNGHDEVVRLLKEHMARVPVVDWDFRSKSTDMEEHSSTARSLVDRTPRTIGGNERTATSLHPNQQLIRAARGGNLHEVHNLLQVGADINSNDDEDETALIAASRNGHVEVVKELLLNDKVDHRTIAGALLIASRMGRDEVVEELIYHEKVDVNLPLGNGETALFTASSLDKLGVVQLLLQHQGLNVNLQNGKGQTALWVACERGNLKVVRTLLRDNRVNVNVETKIGSTAVNVANVKGHDEVVRLLKEHTARVPAVDEMSSQVRYPMDLDIIMEEDSSTALVSIDRTPRPIGANEGAAAPPHRLVEVLDKDVTVNDVLYGRGGRSNNHPGNKRYLKIVADNKIEYKATKEQEIKTSIAEAIVKDIHKKGGRFLKKEGGAQSWRVMTFKEAKTKVSQALREKEKVVNAIENR